MRYFFIRLQRQHKKTRDEFLEELNKCVPQRIAIINKRVFGG
jgi:hypothetical protein